MDGITIDQYRNIYVATHQGGCIYSYDSAINNPPQLISSGHNGPAGPHYNKRDNILAVPNFYSNSVDLIPVSLSSVEEEKGTLLNCSSCIKTIPIRLILQQKLNMKFLNQQMHHLRFTMFWEMK